MRKRSRPTPLRHEHWRVLVVAMGVLLGAFACWGLSDRSFDAPRASWDTRVEHARQSSNQELIAPRSISVRVPRAPIFERLALADLGARSVLSTCSQVTAAEQRLARSRGPRDARIRRKLPRLNTDEPPWS